MISKEKLEKLLRDAKFDEVSIERILKKRINQLLKIGNEDEIKNILKVLEEHQISKEKIEKCLTVLAYGKAKEIEEIFKILDKNEIIPKNIEENYGVIFIKTKNEIEEVFSNNCNTNILLYLKLKNMYNKIISNDQIDKICEFKGMTKLDLFKQIGLDSFESILLNTLQQKGNIYIGKSIPMTKEQMEKYSYTLIEIAKSVSKNVAYKYRIKDISELESLSIEIIISKCGDTVYNTEINTEVMKRCIYNKCKKYIIGKIIGKNYMSKTSVDELIEKRSKYSIDRRSNIEQVDDLNIKQWGLNTQQEEILKSLSIFIEQGYNYQDSLKNVADILQLDLEELIYDMEEIKEILVQKEERER